MKVPKKQQIAKFIFRKAFKSYNDWVRAEDIVKRVHYILANNQNTLRDLFAKRTCRPLVKITQDPIQSKRHIISFLRSLAKDFKNRIVWKKKSVVLDMQIISVYHYRMVMV